MTDLQGRSVVVSGGSDGIGLACVHEFASQGANVTVGDLKLPGEERIAELSKLPGTAEFVQCDVTDSAAVKAWKFATGHEVSELSRTSQCMWFAQTSSSRFAVTM